MNKNKLRELLGKLKTIEESLPLKETRTYVDQVLGEEAETFKQTLKGNPTVKYLEGFEKKLAQFKKEFNLEPIISAIEKIESDIELFKKSSGESMGAMSDDTNNKYSEIVEIIKATRKEFERFTSKEVKSLVSQMAELQGKLTFQSQDAETKGKSISEVIQTMEGKFDKLYNKLSSSVGSNFKNSSDSVKKVATDLEDARQEMLRLIANNRGGAMNRQIKVDGLDVLKSYTDINLISGAGVTISASDDNTEKNVDITFDVSGTGQNTFTGSVNGTNNIFVFERAPNALSVDNVPRQMVSSDGTVNWTVVGTTVTLTVAPNFDLFAIN